MTMPSVASSKVAGNVRRMSCITGFDVSTDVPKSPCSDLAHVDVELLPQRLVEAELLAHAGDDVLRRAVADDGEDGIDRDHPADEERDGQQTQVGQQDDDEEAPDDVRRPQQARSPATAFSRATVTSSRP